MMGTIIKLESSQNVENSECPICIRIPRGKIFQCVNGHSICDSCTSKVTFCPTCRCPGVCTRNLALEKKLDKMKFKCNWNEQGCNEALLRSELSAHEDKCDRK